VLAGFCVLLAASGYVFAQVGLPRGEDVVDVPSVGKGLCVHNLFQSNMVIQRDRPIRIWGWAEPNETVSVSLAGLARKAVAAKDRSWAVTFPAMSASTKPIRIVIKGRTRTVTLENILLGDVWLLGGQSNMEHPICRVENGDLEMASANYPNIRILTVPSQNGPDHRKSFPRLQEWHSFFRQHYRKGDWDVCSPEIVRELSGIGYVFARRIHMASRVPIGVIDVSRGGTCLETWMPVSVFKKIATPQVRAKLAEWDKKIAEYDPQKDLEARKNAYKRRVAVFKKRGQKIPAELKAPTATRPNPAVMNMNRPGNCYASMIAPIAGLPVRGAIWHQGYNNAMEAEGSVMYYQAFAKMIDTWRAAFNDPKMPFGIVALCTDGPPQTLDNYLEMMVNEGIYIRQVQYKTFLDLQAAGDKNIGFASSFDMRRNWYHPGLKVPVGERIARWALATQYGKNNLEWIPPKLTKMSVEEGRIILKLDAQVDTLERCPIEGFAIAGEDRRFQPATAEPLLIKKDSRNRPQYDHSTIVLSSPHVARPIHFRYAWGRNPMGNLKSRFGGHIPFATQRSDDWKIFEVPVKFGATASRQTAMDARKALKLDDMERRLKDARAFIEKHADTCAKERSAWQKQRQK